MPDEMREGVEILMEPMMTVTVEFRSFNARRMRQTLTHRHQKTKSDAVGDLSRSPLSRAGPLMGVDLAPVLYFCAAAGMGQEAMIRFTWSYEPCPLSRKRHCKPAGQKQSTSSGVCRYAERAACQEFVTSSWPSTNQMSVLSSKFTCRDRSCRGSTRRLS